MNDNIDPKLNIRLPQDSMYGLSPSSTQPDLRNLYDQNTVVTSTKITAPPSTNSQASLRIVPGSSPNSLNVKDGDIWIDSIKKSLVYFTTDGTFQGKFTFMDRTFYSNTFRKSITGVSADTLAYPGTNIGIIDQQYFAVNKSIKVTARGILTTTALGNLRIRVDLTTTHLFDTGSISVAAGFTNALWTLDCEFIINSLDPSGAIDGQGYFQYYNGANWNVLPMINTTNLSVVPLDGGDRTLNATAIWSANGNTLTVTNLRTELL